MQITVRENQGMEEWVVAIKGSFDFETARAFLAEMKNQTWSGKARIVFDLVDAEHLESSGLGAMLLVAERMRSPSRPVIRCGHERVWGVLRIAHMERIFDLVPVGPLQYLVTLTHPSAAAAAKAKALL